MPRSAGSTPNSGSSGSLWISPLAVAPPPHYRWLVGRGYLKLPVFTLELPA
jgi:hypothetical protein